MDNEKLYDFLKAAEHPLSIGEINAHPEFREIPRRELSSALRQLAQENLAFRSVRNGKAFYSADPAEGVSRNPCQKNIADIASAMNQTLNAAQNPEAAMMGKLFNALDNLAHNMEDDMESDDSEHAMIEFTYNDGVVADCEGYSISIPDGFKLEMGLEGRDFIAWLPREGYGGFEEAKISLYAGQSNDTAKIEEHIKCPELFAALIRATQWEMKAKTDRFLGPSVMGEIPLLGEVSGSYLYSDCNYQIMLGFPSGIKQMRVLANTGTSQETYHQAVTEWIATLKLKEKFPVHEGLDNERYLPLTAESLKSWEAVVEKTFQRISAVQNMNMQARVKQFQYDQQYGNESFTLLKKDVRSIAERAMTSVEAACESMAAFLKRACIADRDNRTLLELYKVVANQMDQLTIGFNLDDQPIKVVSARTEELKNAIELPEIKELKAIVEKEEAERKAVLAAEKARQEAERREAERIRKEKEAAEKAEQERIRKEKEKEAIARANVVRERYALGSGMMACSHDHCVAVKPDGTVVAVGENQYGQCNVSAWKNIVQVVCDNYGTAGLTAQGTVVYTGNILHKQNQCTKWTNVKELAMTNECIFALHHDGTVSATTEGKNGPHFSSKPDVTTWRGIRKIRAGEGNVLGIDGNGTITAINRNYYGNCQEDYYMDRKANAVDAEYGYLSSGIILHKNGTCSTAGTHYSYIKSPTEINKHKGIVKVYLLGNRPLAILSDGTLVIESKEDRRGNDKFADFVRRNQIKKVVAFSGNFARCAILTEDGKIYTFSENSIGGHLPDGQCFGNNFRLFDNFHKMLDLREQKAEQLRREAEEKRRQQEEEVRRQAEQKAAEERHRAELRAAGLCQHCGGTFKKGLFSTKCTSCGKKKDYSSDDGKESVSNKSKLPIVLLIVVLAIAVAAGVLLFGGGSKSSEAIHVTTEYDMETIMLELTEDNEGKLRVSLEDIKQYIPEAEHLEWEGVPAMGNDIDEYIRDGFHMACLIGSHGEEGGDDQYGYASVGNDPDSPRALMVFSDLTTLCGYAVGVPEDLGSGKWAVEITRCDYDFAEMYKEQHRAFYNRDDYEFIPADEVEEHNPDTFIYAYNMSSIAEQYNMEQMYHLWQQANSPYLERHLRDFEDQWERRGPSGDENDPTWRYYLLYDENREIIGYTIRTTAKEEWFNQNVLTTAYDLEKVMLTMHCSDSRCEVSVEELQAIIPETVSLEVISVHDRNRSIDEYLKISQQMMMRVTSNGDQMDRQQRAGMSIWSDQTYVMLLYSDATTLCGYFVGNLMAENDNEITIDLTHCDYDFSALYQNTLEDFSNLTWEENLKYYDSEYLEQSDAEYFIGTYFMSDKIENAELRHWYHLWSTYDTFRGKEAYVPLEYMNEWYGNKEHNTPMSIYFLLLDNEYDIVGYTVLK